MLPKVPQAQIEKYIEAPQSLYVIKQAVSESDDSGAVTMLKFAEDMCFDEMPQRFPGPFADKFLIDGPGFPFQVCPLSKREPIVEQSSKVFIDEAAGDFN